MNLMDRIDYTNLRELISAKQNETVRSI